MLLADNAQYLIIMQNMFLNHDSEFLALATWVTLVTQHRFHWRWSPLLQLEDAAGLNSIPVNCMLLSHFDPSLGAENEASFTHYAVVGQLVF